MCSPLDEPFEINFRTIHLGFQLMFRYGKEGGIKYTYTGNFLYGLHVHNLLGTQRGDFVRVVP